MHARECKNNSNGKGTNFIHEHCPKSPAMPKPIEISNRDYDEEYNGPDYCEHPAIFHY